MRRTPDRLASKIGTAVVLILLSVVIALRAIGTLLAAVVRIFAFVRLLIILAFVLCVIQVRRLRLRLAEIAR